MWAVFSEYRVSVDSMIMVRLKETTEKQKQKQAEIARNRKETGAEETGEEKKLEETKLEMKRK